MGNEPSKRQAAAGAAAAAATVDTGGGNCRRSGNPTNTHHHHHHQQQQHKQQVSGAVATKHVQINSNVQEHSNHGPNNNNTKSSHSTKTKNANTASGTPSSKTTTTTTTKQAKASTGSTTTTNNNNNNNNSSKKKKYRMEESAHTFAPSAHSVSTHYSRRNNASPVMVTDALGDVRVNYHIEGKELGHGHYGVVRKCMHRESRNWYAVKSIRKAKVSKIEVLKREIEILKEVKHPHIIELMEVYEDERYLHLITELCTGGELFDRIIAKTQSEEGHFSEHDAAALVRDILDAIAYCHDEKQIVHRDLKPENFLFSTIAEDAPIKIIDFGLSRHDDAALGIMQTKVGSKWITIISQ